MSDPTDTTRLASLKEDGSRRTIHPADVTGRYARARKAVFALLIVVLIGIPWLRIGGNPVLLLDIEHRRFYFAGVAFNAQDAWLVFFLLTGLGFGLVALTTLLGRVWCGWACPQTVFIDGVYRRIERWIEGPASAREKLERSLWTFEKIWKRGLKHAAYVAVSLFLSHAVLGYFVPVRALMDMITHSPTLHPEAFAWVAATTALLYFDFGWFREQFCVVMCPYGRLQGVLTDHDSVVVGYDKKRGEPRGKLNVIGNGDCVDCKRCVVVCPTGIDIRDGLQLECIGCTACVDACDEIMVKVGKPVGLIRHDSERGFQGEGKTRYVRARTLIYAAAGVLGLVVLTLSLRTRKPFEASLLRPRGLPFVVDGGEIRNQLRLHVVGKGQDGKVLRVEPVAAPNVTFVVPQPELRLAGDTPVEVPLFVSVPTAQFHGDFPLSVRLVPQDGGEPRVVSVTFLGPK